MDNVNVFLMSLKGKIADEALVPLKNSLEKAGESGVEKLMFLRLKNPVVGIVLSLLFGILGVDRFYKGDIKLGVGKIALWLVSFTLLIAGVFSGADMITPAMSDEEIAEVILSEAAPQFLLGIIGILASYVWWIVDIFLVFFGIKKDNLAKIYVALQ